MIHIGLSPFLPNRDGDRDGEYRIYCTDNSGPYNPTSSFLKKKKDSTDVMEGMQHGRFVLSARIKSVKVAQTTKSDNVNLTLYAVVNVTLCADPKHNSILIVFNLIISHC